MKNRSVFVSFVRVTAEVLFILMIIFSFILGEQYKTVKESPYSSFSTYSTIEYQYNWGVAIGGVILSTITFGLLYSVSYGVERLDSINESLRYLVEKEKRAETTQQSSSQGTSSVAQAIEKIRCPSCDKLQPYDRPSCIACGATLRKK